MTVSFAGTDGNQEAIDIAAGKSAKVSEFSLDDDLTISFDGAEHRYEIYVFAVSSEYAPLRRISLFPRRRLRVQLNSDGRIWAVRPKQKLPVSSFEEQPANFPVTPLPS